MWRRKKKEILFCMKPLHWQFITRVCCMYSCGSCVPTLVHNYCWQGLCFGGWLEIYQRSVFFFFFLNHLSQNIYNIWTEFCETGTLRFVEVFLTFNKFCFCISLESYIHCYSIYHFKQYVTNRWQTFTVHAYCIFFHLFLQCFGVCRQGATFE